MKTNNKVLTIFIILIIAFTIMPISAFAMYDDGADKYGYPVNPPIGLTLTYNGKEQSGVQAYKGSNLINDYGYDVYDYKATNAGKYTATACLWGAMGPQSFVWSDGTTEDKKITFVINKAANSLAVKGKSAIIKYKKLKKKNQKLSVTRVIAFTKSGQGKITYKKASGNKKITINKITGKITVKKGLKKGKYNVKVKTKASGNSNYKASDVLLVTIKVVVK